VSIGASFGKANRAAFDPLEWAHIALNADNEQTAWTKLSNQLLAAGFERSAYVFGIPTQLARNNFPLKTQRFGQIISPAWEAHMDAHPEQAINDPIAPRAAAGDGCIIMLPSISKMPRLKPKEWESFHRFEDFGLTGGMTISVHDRLQGNFAALMLTHVGNPKPCIEAVDAYLGELRLAVTYMTEGFRVRAMTQSDQPPRLSARERECLLWSAAGRTTKEIADILNLSDATVNEYFSGAKRKLGASTRTQACARAFILSLIQP